MTDLRFDQVSVYYPGQDGPVLDRVSLALAPGELVAVIGASGCGKTTMLNLVAGFQAPASGRVMVDGRDVTGPGADRAVVFQDDALFPWLDTLGNATFAARMQGVPRTEREARARAVLAQVGLAGAEGRRIWELSGGMRQRLGLARALVADPAILLLDEPFAALDALTRETVQELLLTLWGESGKTVMLVTHDIEEALFLATRVIVMAPHPGRIVDAIKADFGRRFLAGEATRALKSDPAFIRLREQVLAGVFARAAA